MLRLIKLGPAFSTPLDAVQDTGPGHFKTPLRPLSAVEESIETTDPSAQNSKEKPHD
jgi:cytochrome d ubiquinol oxidase subunit I